MTLSLSGVSRAFGGVRALDDATFTVEDGEVHGLENTGASAFEYLSVTAPPLNFRAAYAAELQTK